MPAARERLYLFDTTLRDGAQTNGVDFTLTDKLAIIRMLDELGIDYVEGGYPGANPTDTQLFSEPRMLHTTFTAFGMVRRPGRSTSNDPGLAALLDAKAERDLLRRQVLGLSRPRRARDHARGKSRLDPRQRAAPPRRRAARCCSTASISSTATRPIRPMRWPAPRPPTRRARAGWCCATPTAARCRTRSRPSSREVVKHIPGDHRRHPRPQRHRAGGGEFVCRRARRRPPDPGHAQRARRALRQRQSRLHHPDAEAQAGIFRAVRDRRLGRAAEEPRPRLARARRAAQPLRRTAMRPMSAKAPSPPRPASMPRRS